ncbi:MAG: DNA polymerase IV [Pseudomonadales bacterium]
MSLTQRKIIHCDCDCFYAAVEMRDNPSLREVPLAIGGRSDRRGVIATSNYVARQYGVRSAMSSALAVKRCPALVLMPGDMNKYRQVSLQIFDIYREITELIEPLSLDEAYLDVSEVTRFNGSATRIAEYLRYRVEREVGITISAGVAPNKFLAKVASDWHKPNGLKVVVPDDVEAFVAQLPVSKIHGVGKKTSQKLSALKIESCRDLKLRGAEFLTQHFGVFGQRLFELSQGIDHRVVCTQRDSKSVSVEHTFAQDLPSSDACVAQLIVLQQALARRFRNLKQARTVTGLFVKLKFNDFSQTTMEQQAVLGDEVLFSALIAEAFKRGNKPVRLIGLGYRLSEQRVGHFQQLALSL